MPRLRDRSDDLQALAASCADEKGLPPEFVEKDFWIVEMLRSLAEPIQKAEVIFKGGTSLSKAFSLIDRFSEDVDILLEIDSNAGVGKGSVDKILKWICERVGSDLGIPVDSQELIGSTRGIRREIRYMYPKQERSGLLSEGVLLEMGIRGGTNPREQRQISSFIADYVHTNLEDEAIEFDELLPVTIRTLSPIRTLIEKVALVHDAVSRYPASESRLVQIGRHYYDIARILSSDGIKEELAKQDVAGLAADIDGHSEKNEWTFTPRPEDGYGSSLAFDPEHPSHQLIRESYEAIRQLVYGRWLPFEDCLTTIRGNSGLL